MNNGEYYVSREDNYVGENKSFPAEIYRKVIEENSLGRETADRGREITTLQKRSGAEKRNKDGSNKTLIDKVFNSVKSIATTATVAVSAIVVSSTVMANTVNAELVDIDVGSDYVEYEMQISDMDEKDDCFVIVSSPSETIHESEIYENGLQSARIEGLNPEWEYTLSVVSRDGIVGDITCFQHKFQTEKHQEYAPDPPPESYNGAYEIPDINNAAVDWSEKQMALPIVFENVDGKYFYRLRVTRENGALHRLIEGHESSIELIDISDETDTYNFVFEIYGLGTNEEKLIISHDLGMRELARPTARVTDISLIGENLIRIDLSLANADKITLRLDYPDGNYEDFTLTQSEISRGYVEASVPDTASKLKVTPTIVLDSYTLPQQATEKDFTGKLEIDTVVNLQSNSIDLCVKAITQGAYYLHVESQEDNSIVGDYSLWEGKASAYYSVQGNILLTVYLTDEVGTRLSDEVELTVDTLPPETMPNYIMNYKNPNDVAVTYNDDGTVNVYINTEFECADGEYFYRIELGKYRMNFKEPVAVFKNLPNETYPITYYYLCYEKEGIIYTTGSVSPSGTVNEGYFGATPMMESELIGNTLVLNAYKGHNLDLSSIRLVSSDGQEILISESDFVSDKNGGQTANIVFDNPPEYINVYIMICPNPYIFEIIGEYEGNKYIPYEEQIYPQ